MAPYSLSDVIQVSQEPKLIRKDSFLKPKCTTDKVNCSFKDYCIFLNTIWNIFG